MCNHGERHETSGSEWWGSEKAGGEKMEERATSHTAERSTRLTLSAGAKTTCSKLNGAFQIFKRKPTSSEKIQSASPG